VKHERAELIAAAMFAAYLIAIATGVL